MPVAKRRPAAHTEPASARRRLPAASGTASLPPPVPWNKGVKTKKADRQHLHVPREDVPVFLAACVFFAGPVYAAVIWLTMVTSRRISEALQLKGSDIFLEGGPNHDYPHIYFAVKEDYKDVPGMGKLAGAAVARLTPEAVKEIHQFAAAGLEWKVMPALEPHKDRILSYVHTYIHMYIHMRTHEHTQMRSISAEPAGLAAGPAGRDNWPGRLGWTAGWSGPARETSCCGPAKQPGG